MCRNIIKKKLECSFAPPQRGYEKQVQVSYKEFLIKKKECSSVSRSVFPNVSNGSLAFWNSTSAIHGNVHTSPVGTWSNDCRLIPHPLCLCLLQLHPSILTVNECLRGASVKILPAHQGNFNYSIWGGTGLGILWEWFGIFGIFGIFWDFSVKVYRIFRSWTGWI